jgi:hypothetical protein
MPGIIAPTADFSAAGLGRALQLTTNRNGLVGEFLFGRNLATSRINSAGLKANAAEALIGTAQAPAPAPIYGDHQVELGNGAGIDTGVVATPTQTIMLVATVASVDADQLPAIAILHGASFGDPARANMGIQAPSINFSVSADGNAVLPAKPSGAFTAPRALVSRIGGLAAGSVTKLDEYMGGVRTQGGSSAITNARPAPTYTTVIGNSNTLAAGGAFQARLRYTSALIWSRMLTDAEVLAAYLELRMVLAQMGKAI